jgi:hypothetical protein
MLRTAGRIELPKHRTEITKGLFAIRCSCGWEAFADTQETAETEERSHSTWASIRLWEELVREAG